METNARIDGIVDDVGKIIAVHFGPTNARAIARMAVCATISRLNDDLQANRERAREIELAAGDLWRGGVDPCTAVNMALRGDR